MHKPLPDKPSFDLFKLLYLSCVPQMREASESKVRRFLQDPNTLRLIKSTMQKSWQDFEGPQKWIPPTLDVSTPDTKLPEEVKVVLSESTTAEIQAVNEAPTPATPSQTLVPDTAKKEPGANSSMNPIPIPLAFSVPNAKAGSDYQGKIELITRNAPAFTIQEILIPSELGLSADPETLSITGTPLLHGEFTLTLYYTLVGSSLRQTSLISLLVNPDPRSLWKNLPSDATAPYWKPDQEHLTLTAGATILTAASKRGRSHAHVGSFRDDDFYLAHLQEGEWDIAIVSDGAGSAKYSRRGSQIICHDGGPHLEKLLLAGEGERLIQTIGLWHKAKEEGKSSETLEKQIQALLYTTLGYAAHHVTRQLQNEANQHADAVFKDYSSTAIISLSRRFPFGVFCAAYWVGDGAVAVLGENAAPVLLGASDSGEYSGQTRFLDPSEVTQEALLRRISFCLCPDFKAMLLMTDGISDPFFETEANLIQPDKWSELWCNMDQQINWQRRDPDLGQRLCDWLDFWSAGNHDDRTIAVIY